MIFGLTGFAGSGKDTAANHLVTKHGFYRVSFAEKLREFCYEINPYIPDGQQGENGIHRLRDLVDDYGWDTAKRDYIAVREFLQSVGHGARVAFSDSFWIERALTINVLKNEHIVVSDVRYQNEIDYIASLDGFIINIRREDVGPVNNHITEKPLPFDYVVQNPVNDVRMLFFNLDQLIHNLNSLTR